MDISGKTKVTGLFGWPVEHSLSPFMHNAAYRHLGLDYCYVTFPVRPEFLKDAVQAIRALDIKGVNVTVPHKENVIAYLDEVDKEASALGAVNTIVNTDGRLKGYNTDGRGFMKSLDEADIETKGKNILVIGAGGASRAISYYLCQKALKFYIFDIDREKAENLSKSLATSGRQIYLMQSLDAAKDMDIIINATPLGLKDSDPMPIDRELIKKSMTVIDLIYRETALLKEAKNKGCKTLDGLGMLLWQGVIAFELWSGIKPPADIMQKALLNAITGKA